MFYKKGLETGVISLEDQHLIGAILGYMFHEAYRETRKLDKPNEQGLMYNPREKKLTEPIDAEFAQDVLDGKIPQSKTLFVRDGVVIMDIANTDFVQPFKLDKPGEKVVYINAKPAKAYRAKDKKAVQVRERNNALGQNGKAITASARNVYEYTFEVPEDGRYFVMLHGYTTGNRSSVLASVNDDKMQLASLQAKKYMTWMPLAPGGVLGNKNRHYDLKKGTHKLRIQGGRHVFFFDGIVVTDSPASFEQR